MTETSFYWAGTSNGDAGPYAENTMWRNLAQAAIAGNAESDSDLYNIGVFYSVANKLEVTLDGVNLDVDTGAALVDGAYYENDASVDITVDAAAAGDERIDYIVLRKCYEGASYNPGGNVPVVEDQEVRITVIKGTEVTPPAVPSTPSLTQDTSRTTYWDIPLATVEVDDTGATSVTDAREYVDAETKSVLLFPQVGYNVTSTSDILQTHMNLGAKMLYSPGTPPLTQCAITFIVGKDFISDMDVSAIIIAAGPAGGNVVTSLNVAYAQIGETRATHSASTSGTITIPGGILNLYNTEILETSLPSASVGDIVDVEFQRDQTDASDTFGNNIFLRGILVEYFGWK